MPLRVRLGYGTSGGTSAAKANKGSASSPALLQLASRVAQQLLRDHGALKLEAIKTKMQEKDPEFATLQALELENILRGSASLLRCERRRRLERKASKFRPADVPACCERVLRNGFVFVVLGGDAEAFGFCRNWETHTLTRFALRCCESLKIRARP